MYTAHWFYYYVTAEYYPVYEAHAGQFEYNRVFAGIFCWVQHYSQIAYAIRFWHLHQIHMLCLFYPLSLSHRRKLSIYMTSLIITLYYNIECWGFNDVAATAIPRCVPSPGLVVICRGAPNKTCCGDMNFRRIHRITQTTDIMLLYNRKPSFIFHLMAVNPKDFSSSSMGDAVTMDFVSVEVNRSDYHRFFKFQLESMWSITESDSIPLCRYPKIQFYLSRPLSLPLHLILSVPTTHNVLCSIFSTS